MPTKPDAVLPERIRRYADARNAPEVPFFTDIEGFSMVRCRTPTSLQATAYTPLLCVVLQGSKESYFGATPVRFSAGESLIVSLELPTVSRVVDASVEAPYLALALELDLGLIRELYAEADDADFEDDEVRAIDAGVADEALVEAMGRLFDLVERPNGRRVLVPLLVREIHFRLLLARHGGMLRHLAQSHTHASRITRALKRIRSSFTEPLRIEELASLAAMSPSSFYEHFKSVTGTTPLQYQKDLRLLEARRRMLAGGQSVSSVAFEVGYESSAQFSREYSRKFGIAPSQERKSLQLP